MNYFDKKDESNSGLGQINPLEGGSPAKYLNFYDKNKERKYSVSLERGTLLHSYIENPSQFVISDVEKPSEMMCRWVEEVRRKGKEEPEKNIKLVIFNAKIDLGIYSNLKDEDKITAKFLAEGEGYRKFLNQADGKIAVSGQTKTIIELAKNSLITNPKANQLLFDELDALNGVEYHKELEVYWIILTGLIALPCKAKLDRVIFDPVNKKVTLVDLKTTSYPVTLFPTESFQKYHYYRQMSFYREAIKQYMIQRGWNYLEWSLEVKMVVVETTGLIETKVFDVGILSLRKGTDEWQSLINRIAVHKSTNEWNMTVEEMENDGQLLIQ